jgi:hypothetical protein
MAVPQDAPPVSEKLGELGRRCEFVQSCICWNGRIFFGYYPDLFAVWGQGHEHWWAEYGDTAMEILDSAVFGK